jgi:hypothetical protein
MKLCVKSTSMKRCIQKLCNKMSVLFTVTSCVKALFQIMEIRDKLFPGIFLDVRNEECRFNAANS